MDKPGAPLLLSVDEDFALPVDLLKVEVAAVEQHLHVRFGHLGAWNGEVVSERPPDRRHRLAENKGVRRTFMRKPFEQGHREKRAPATRADPTPTLPQKDPIRPKGEAFQC